MSPVRVSPCALRRRVGRVNPSGHEKTRRRLNAHDFQGLVGADHFDAMRNRASETRSPNAAIHSPEPACRGENLRGDRSVVR